MHRLQGQLFGDPDFCVLDIQAGDQFGLPSPGGSTLTDNGNGTFSVDSFFDVSYEITYQGCPGSQLEGFGGTSSGTLRMQSGLPAGSAAPGIRGPWLILFALLLAGASLLAIMRRPAAQR